MAEDNMSISKVTNGIDSSGARPSDVTDTREDGSRPDIEVEFSVEDTPPIGLCILLGFQHYISMFVATLSIPMVLSPAICMFEDNVGKSELTGTLFVASGLITLLQNLVGVRLPIVQAGTFALLAPTLAYLNLPQWSCPDNIVHTGANVTNLNESLIIMGSPEHREVWTERLRVVQGSLMVAAVVELVLGLSGAVGVLLRFIGPLSICPTISLLGLSLFQAAARFGAKHWWICILTMVLMIVFSQYLGKVNIPLLAHNKTDGWHRRGYPLLTMFPVILATVITWFLSYILTVTNVFPSDPSSWGYAARTDLRTDAIHSSPWFRIPYPGQWGTPTISIACVCGLLAGIVATMVESVGDYHACARLSGAPPPPTHAINRGIFIEGLGSFIDGILGTGNGTTSTSINVGVIGITKVGSRSVVVVSALFMIGLGIFTKFGALFVTIPDPVIGGSFFILFGMIVAVGISNLQYVNLNSSRNLFIFGFAFFFGLTVPVWISDKTNAGAIKTGSQLVDSIVTVLLSTNMFVGGMIGFILDNTIPGTPEERGIAHWTKLRDAGESGQSRQLVRRLEVVYDVPYISRWLERIPMSRYFPICPTFGRKQVFRTPSDEETMVSADAETQGIARQTGSSTNL